MQREPGVKWLFLDMNSFFASVEQQEQPRLRGRPVAVVPVMSDATCAIAASTEAKRYGVKTGTKIYEAKRMCPGLVCVLARHDVYVRYHNRIVEEVALHTPINKIWSIDELSSRLPPGRRDPDRALDVAHRIKAGLRKNIGETVTCSIGIAPNSLLGKIAAGMKKPNGLVCINQDDLPDALLDLKLTKIPGVGRNMEQRLWKSGIATMKALLDTEPKQMRKIWNSVQGERLWYWLHGYDFELPETGNVMLGHSRVLDPALRDPESARLMVRRLLSKACYRLRRNGHFAGVISLSLRTVSGNRSGAEASLPHAQDAFTFLRHLDDLWPQAMYSIHGKEGPYARILKVGVTLHGLKRPEEITGDLFSACAEQGKDQEQHRKHLALTAALDRLQERYQRETVTVGVIPKTASGHVGTKIAFSRVPKPEEFWS